MVTPQGFNALLKLVEEPPEHLKFIFATTEPDKVIGTIRSRTHHYPFRLIPPRHALGLPRASCASKEGVAIEPAALPLVVRAGGGSARDTLSVLDQLMGGAGPEGVTYDAGHRPARLHPRHPARRGRRRVRRRRRRAPCSGWSTRSIETGQDPRRFTEDLLRRLRDLVIVSAVPDAPATGLIDVPEDQGERLVAQAARFGRADLSRAADLVADGLTEMQGATAPRLLLELICARVLLPGADHGTEGVLARLDRLEKRMSIEGTPERRRAAPAAPRAGAPPGRRPAPAEPAAGRAARPSPRRQPAAEAAEPRRRPQPEPAPEPAPSPRRAEPAEPAEPAGAGARRRRAAGTSSGLSLVDVRRLWPDIVEAVKPSAASPGSCSPRTPRSSAVDDKTLTLGAGQRRRPRLVRQRRQRGDRAAGGDRRGRPRLAGRDDRRPVAPQPGAEPPHAGHPAGGRRSARRDRRPRPPARRRRAAAAPEAPSRRRAGRPGVHRGRPRRDPGHPARPATRGSRAAGRLRRRDAHRDDPDADDHGLGGAELLERELGASVIEEIQHD